MEADKGEVLARTPRFDLAFPAASRDAAALALFNDPDTMLPHLHFLFPMTRDALSDRRARQRAGHTDGTSWCVDVLDRRTRALVALSGFRSVDGNAAEFGVIVDKTWQRRGCLAEVFEACAAVARGDLGCRRLVVATLEANAPMRAFVERRTNLELVGEIVSKSTNKTAAAAAHDNEGLRFLKYEADLATLRVWVSPSSLRR